MKHLLQKTTPQFNERMWREKPTDLEYPKAKIRHCRCREHHNVNITATIRNKRTETKNSLPVEDVRKMLYWRRKPVNVVEKSDLNSSWTTEQLNSSNSGRALPHSFDDAFSPRQPIWNKFHKLTRYVYSIVLLMPCHGCASPQGRIKVFVAID